MKNRIVSALLPSLLLVSASAFAQPEQRTYNIEGRAVDSVSSAPIQGAEAELVRVGFSATTDADGRFRIFGTEQSGALSGTFSLSSRADFLSATRELRLSLGTAGPVELTLFDVRGQSRLLHRGSHAAGEYTFALDAMLDRPLGAGVYVLRVKTGEFTETFKLAGTG